MEINKAALFQYLLGHISVNVSICVHVYLYLCVKWMNWIELWVYFYPYIALRPSENHAKTGRGGNPNVSLLAVGSPYYARQSHWISYKIWRGIQLYKHSFAIHQFMYSNRIDTVQMCLSITVYRWAWDPGQFQSGCPITDFVKYTSTVT